MTAGDNASPSPARLRDLTATVNRNEDRDTVDQAVDEIATLAADGFEPAVAELLRLVLDLRMAERPIRTVLLDDADVDDAVQSTLIAVATKISTFEGRSRFRSWVDRVARNEALAVIRRKKRLTEPVTDDVPELDRSARRLSSLVAGEAAFATLLDRLSPEHASVLRLREEEGYSYEDISEQLGVPVGTVRSRINRARKLLAELLLATAGNQTP